MPDAVNPPLAKFGATFGVATLVFLVFLIIGRMWEKTLPPGSEWLVFVFLSLGIALSFSLLGGAAAARGQLPIPGIGSHVVEFTLGGGIAIFVVVLLLLPLVEQFGVRVVPLERLAANTSPTPPLAPAASTITSKEPLQTEASSAASQTTKAIPAVEQTSPLKPQEQPALSTKPSPIVKVLRSRSPQYFSRDGNVRVEYANLVVHSDGRASLAFQAAAMVKASFPGSKGPWVHLQLFDDNGSIGGFVENLFEVAIDNCGGYKNYDVPLGSRLANELLDRAQSFNLQLSGTSPVRC